MESPQGMLESSPSMDTVSETGRLSPPDLLGLHVDPSYTLSEDTDGSQFTNPLDTFSLPTLMPFSHHALHSVPHSLDTDSLSSSVLSPFLQPAMRGESLAKDSHNVSMFVSNTLPQRQSTPELSFYDPSAYSFRPPSASFDNDLFTFNSTQFRFQSDTISSYDHNSGQYPIDPSLPSLNSEPPSPRTPFDPQMSSIYSETTSHGTRAATIIYNDEHHSSTHSQPNDTIFQSLRTKQRIQNEETNDWVIVSPSPTQGVPSSPVMSFVPESWPHPPKQKLQFEKPTFPIPASFFTISKPKPTSTALVDQPDGDFRVFKNNSVSTAPEQIEEKSDSSDDSTDGKDTSNLPEERHTRKRKRRRHRKRRRKQNDDDWVIIDKDDPNRGNTLSPAVQQPHIGLTTLIPQRPSLQISPTPPDSHNVPPSTSRFQVIPPLIPSPPRDPKIHSEPTHYGHFGSNVFPYPPSQYNCNYPQYSPQQSGSVWYSKPY
ncbi:hypothetical protein BLNAU_21003 [Blattamonas nauphoetae]|uniref:Uncharacterized protein n=1 Tax=Blattamonas nauphoetae TaxID=2049346 RepID=A0ABQ9WX54_9EUKA|nr:hypothetical protein BLNAU_21003 [Blattamonas nauphoetae]